MKRKKKPAHLQMEAVLARQHAELVTVAVALEADGAARKRASALGAQRGAVVLPKVVVDFVAFFVVVLGVRGGLLVIVVIIVGSRSGRDSESFGTGEV